MAVELLPMQWPLPVGVRAAISLRRGGSSSGAFTSANMGDHVGDSEHAVAANRSALHHQLKLPSSPLWLNQIHSSKVIDSSAWQPNIEADGCYSKTAGAVCVAMGADCLPLLLCDASGGQVAAVHVGWRGLVGGVIEAALMHFDQQPLLAYLGPAIGAADFEVGSEVREQVLAGIASYPADSALETVFVPRNNGKYLMNLTKLVQLKLHKRGQVACFGGDINTLAEPERGFSYRRDGTTGRHAALIWIE